MANNGELIRQFTQSWCDMDLDRIMSFFNDDAVYINIPIDPPNNGIEAIRTTISGFLAMATEIAFVVHHQVENDEGIIMNERTDRFLIDGDWKEIKVMGVFEIKQGKISAWRDYFDMAQFSQQLS